MNILQIGDSHCVSGDIIKNVTNNYFLYAKTGKTYHYFNKNFSIIKDKIQKDSIETVIISLGTNDCFNGVSNSFKSEVIKLVDSIKPYCSNILLTSPPYNKHQQYMENCASVLREVAIEENILFFDLNSREGYRKYIAKDKVHYSSKGYSIMGSLILNFLVNNL